MQTEGEAKTAANSREQILVAARLAAQARGYEGLNFRDLAAEVGVKAASIYYYFPSKADLAAAVARRYWEDAAAYLDSMLENAANPMDALRRYPETFRWALENGNRMCLASIMVAEDELPEEVRREVQAFADVNVAWLKKVLKLILVTTPEVAERRAHAIYASVAGAQLAARGRRDPKLYDQIIDSYLSAELFPE